MTPAPETPATPTPEQRARVERLRDAHLRGVQVHYGDFVMREAFQADADALTACLAALDAADTLRAHRCGGCGHRWSGDAPGTLCGECWRKGQSVLRPPANDLVTSEWGDAVAAILGYPGAPSAEATERLIAAGDRLLLALRDREERHRELRAELESATERHAYHLETAGRLARLTGLVREWQEARKPATLSAPGEFLAETFQAAVRRMSAADEALAGYRLDGPDDETEQCVEVETPVAGKRAQTPNEAEMLRALSDALTGGNASTWEHVLHAAQTLNAVLEDESTGPLASIAWLVETHILSDLHYLRSWNARLSEPEWTARNDEAWRFARREDADKALVYLAGGNGRVAQHIWTETGETLARACVLCDGTGNEGDERMGDVDCHGCGGTGLVLPSLREELTEIIRWRFKTADGKPMNGPLVLKRAQEIANEIAPYIEEATGER